MPRRVAAMQPYLFPYFGYFQLIAAVDVFVLLDDVQYIRRGWINRNFIDRNGRRERFTLPVAYCPRDTKISEVLIDDERRPAFARGLATRFRQRYALEPGYADAAGVLLSVLETTGDRLCAIARASIEKSCDAVGIQTPIALASEIAPDRSGKLSDRMAALVRAAGGDSYANPASGLELYDAAVMRAQGVTLESFTPDLPEEFLHPVEHLPCSVLDTLARFDESRLATALRGVLAKAS